METIRVLIADDHPVFRYGLRSLLANDPKIEVVGEAKSATSLESDMDRLRPDVLLLDIRMPGSTGIDVAHEMRRNHPDTKVLILTAYDDDEYLMDALRAGVHGYLLKNSSHEVLTSAIRAVHAGQRLVAAEQISKVLEQFETLAQRQAREESGLTDVELKILEHLARGDSYDEMSAQLYLSEPTIKRKIQGILTKMGANSRTQAVAEAIRRGLI
ncbi:MAG: response regulator transcription factor [Ardenticatenaceae bacterium]|nr:response regulator transcription factor [Ardenticatenaceae bacterium]HBY99672.1 DNA-binding response regulator [Chloroflexota bacterium]